MDETDANERKGKKRVFVRFFGVFFGFPSLPPPFSVRVEISHSKQVTENNAVTKNFRFCFLGKYL